jgi:hypothetical protein
MKMKKWEIYVYGSVIIKLIEDINNIGQIRKLIFKLNIKFDYLN